MTSWAPFTISEAQRKKLHQFLKEKEHVEGLVHHSRKGELTFERVERLASRCATFHTHNVHQNNGGYDPPSRKDMSFLLSGNQASHYVVTHRGVYLVKMVCTVGQQRREQLLIEMTQMQMKMKPSVAFNRQWIKYVNNLDPKCLKVAFYGWARIKKQ